MTEEEKVMFSSGWISEVRVKRLIASLLSKQCMIGKSHGENLLLEVLSIPLLDEYAKELTITLDPPVSTSKYSSEMNVDLGRLLL